ncbi:hypothetical protein [Halobaculum sp. EA56]|uniref:DUF7860 family protein n=1 Tax=Halobaculum sp. EA56 TaxID=3421648 RepID=UPI003EC088C1
MAGRYGNLDYPTLTERALLVCVAVFLLAIAVEAAAAVTGTTLPAWERALLVDLELFAVVGSSLSVFVFGVALPLTE